MSPAPHHGRHGLTLLELMLALAVTAMVGLAITGMLGVVTAGVSTHRDVRSTMVRASAAQARLSAYIAPSRCILAVVDSTDVVVWLEDWRAGETINASEVRWLLYNDAEGTIDVHFVDFPETWSETSQALNDKILDADSDWMAVLADYEASGWTRHMPIVDGLASLAVSLNAPDPQASEHIIFDMELAQEGEPAAVQVAATIRLHEPP